MARQSTAKRAPKAVAIASYSQILEERLKDAPPKKKGERTRARLIAAAARVLEQAGYVNVRVSDICDSAETGLATFYLYFENKAEITQELLVAFLDHIGETRAPPAEHASHFDLMVATNLHFMRWFEVNAGLVRCLLQFSDEAPELMQLWQARGHEWYQRIARRMSKEAGPGDFDPDHMLLATYALGGMMDQIFRDLYVHQNRPLQDLVSRVAPTTEKLAHELSLIWYRGAFGRDP